MAEIEAYTLIQPSAWDVNCWKFISSILHIPGLTGQYHPSRRPASPRIPRRRSVPVTMDGYSWECRPRTETSSSRRSCVAGTSRRGIMQIRIARTREDQKPGERDCTICRDVFWLGEATAWAITDENALIGEVCPACLEGGASHIEAKLEERARLSRVIAEQDERIASESVEDVPSVDELLVAETFYGGRG